MKQELYRKSLHLLLILIPIAYYELGKWQSMLIFAPATIFVVSLDYLRRHDPKIQMFFIKLFGPVLREHELVGDKLCGASWVGLATCINFLIFKEQIAITGFTILVISDLAAALVGKSVVSRPFFEKSLAGSTAFFVSGLIILFVCGAIFGARTWFYLFGLFALFCVTIIEARPSLIKIDDNFTIPIVFSVVMTFFDIVWNYNY